MREKEELVFMYVISLVVEPSQVLFKMGICKGRGYGKGRALHKSIDRGRHDSLEAITVIT